MNIVRAKISYAIQDFLLMRVGHIVNITVWDSFSGTVKVVKRGINRWLIEIVDVSMCYPQQVQLEPGDQMWIHSRDIYRD